MSAPAALCAVPPDRNLGETIATFEDMASARAHAQLCLVDDTHIPPLPICVKWKRTGSDGTTKALFVCASHAKCPYEVRCKKENDGFHVQVLWPGLHSSEECFVRTNAVCSPAQRERMLQMANGGSKPGAIWSSLLTERLQLCKSLGQEPEKRPEGGLVGAPEAPKY